MPSTLNPKQTSLTTSDNLKVQQKAASRQKVIIRRADIFSHPEIHAIVRALSEWVPVYANGKRDEVSVSAVDLLAEFSEVALDRYPQS
jgi:hypothetical protein